MPEPINKKLYNKVKDEAKKKFDVYPSIYANSWLVREYKKRGGKYKGKKPSNSGLTRWYKENWIDTCEYLKGKTKKCGRSSVKNMSYTKKKKSYPYCRPLHRVSKKTPKTVKELSKAKLRRLCMKKKSNPKKRMPSNKKSKRKSKKRNPVKKSKRNPVKKSKRKI